MKKTTLRKLTSMILAAALLFTFFAVPIVAADSGQTVMSLTSTSGMSGNNVTIDVNLTANSGMAGGNFTVSYDTSRLEVVSVAAGTLLTGKNPTINPAYQTTKIRVTWATGSAAENNAGTLAKITFKVKDAASAGRASVTLDASSLYNINATAINHLRVNGYVDVNMHTVSFVSNGGIPAPSIQQVAHGTYTSAPSAMTRSGFIFDGWYTAQDLSGSAYNFNTAVTQNMILYAKWSSNACTVTFNSQGGTAVPSITAVIGKIISQPAAPTMSNKTFGGWYKESACTTPWNFATDTIAGTTTLFAKWDTINVTSISVLPERLNLNAGDTKQLTVNYTPGNASNKIVSWNTNNTKVATVSVNGAVTAVGAGTATITATANSTITDTSDISVKARIAGKVTYADGSNAAYTEVRLYNGETESARMYTDWNGNYSFLAPIGNYTVKVIAPNDSYQDTSDSIAVVEGDSVKTADIIVQNAPFENASVTINLTSNSASYSKGFYVYISGYQTNFWDNRYVDGAANGTVTIPNVPYTQSKNSYYVSIYTDDGYWEGREVTVNAAIAAIDFAVPARYAITGSVKTEAQVPVQYVSVIAKGTDGRWYYGCTDANGVYIINGLENGSYTVEMDTWGKYTADSVNVNVNNSDVTTGTDLTAKLAADLVLSVQKNDSTYPYRAYVSVYKLVNAQWQWVNSASVAGDNALLEGAIKGYGDYKLQLESVYDSSWVAKSFVSDPVTFTVDAETDLSQGRVSKILTYSDPTNPSAIFTGDGNLVLTDINLIRNGSRVYLNIKYKNNGNTPVSADFIAVLPAGVATAAGNSNSFSVTNLAQGASGQKSIALDIGNVTGNMLSIPVKVSIGAEQFDFGTASLEIAGVTLNAPGAVKTTESFKVYGEATEGSTIVIKDTISGKVLANAKPNGRWYYAQISNLAEGTYKLIAEMTSGSVTVASQPVTIEAKATQITIVKVKAGSYGSTELPVNSKIGVPAFTAWVDSQLNGRDIALETTFDDIEGLITSVTYHFMGKEYASVKNSEGAYATILNGWSGTGLKNITATVTTSDGRTITFIIAEVTILIDPSGYVIDAETGKKLAGVSVVCEIWDGEKWVKWDAENYGQVNPQITDDEGKYGWMVVDGIYRVKAVKEGYENYDSLSDPNFSLEGNSTIVIPPERKDVNFAMTPTTTVSAISLNKDSTTLVQGQSELLTAIATPNDATNASNIAWSTNDPLVATVDANGQVTAVGPGAATITAAIGTITDTCTVTVNYAASITVQKDGVALATSTSGITYTVDQEGTIYTADIAEGGVFTTIGLPAGYHTINVRYNGAELSNAVISTNKNATYNFLTGGTAVYYTIVYKDWNGNFLKAISIASGDAAVFGTSPTRTGYTFSNWVAESDTSNDATDELLSVNGNITVKAVYTASTSGYYTLSRGLIYSNGGFWFDVTVTRGTAAQLDNPLLKVTYTTGSGQVIAVIPVSSDSNGDSAGNRVFIPNGATNVSVRLVDGNDGSWPTAYKSAAINVNSTQITAGVGN